MLNSITNFFAHAFNGNVVLATVLISMLPIVELRGAIPFATNTVLWGDLALNNWRAMLFGVIGSSVIVPILAFLFFPVINLLKNTRIFNKFALWVENRVKNKTLNLKNGADSAKSSSYWKKILTVIIFVAIPLPFTGVWTGTCVSVCLGIDYLSTCITVILGNIIAGLIIALILQFFPCLNNYLLLIFVLIVALVLVFELIKHLVKARINR